MLLLSSATKILATEHPPTILYPRGPHLARGHTKWPIPIVLEHPPAGASMSTGQACVGSEYYGFGLSHASQSPQNTKGRGFLRPHPSDFPCSSPCRLTHQGMSFFRPFFFLLVDSFALVSVVPLAPDCAVAAVRLGGIRRLSRGGWCRIRLGSCLRRSRRGGTIRGTLPPLVER